MTNKDITQVLFEVLIRLFVLFAAVPVHECAHAVVADKLGDPTPRNQGRITLNPFAHLSLWGSLMFIFAGFGWGKPVMTSSKNLKHPKRDEAIIALAGPLSNLVMAYVSMVILRFCAASNNETAGYIALIFYYSTILNVSLAVLNLLPLPPLDGSKLFGSVLPDKIYYKIMQYERFIVIGVLVIFYTGLLSVPMAFLNDKIISLMMILTDWVDLLIK